MNFPDKPHQTEKLGKSDQPKPKPFYQRTLTSGILLLTFLLLFIYIDMPDSDSDIDSDSDFDSGPPLSFSSPTLILGEPEQLNFDGESSVTIQLNKKSIQASSLTEQTFPLLVSRKIPDFTSPYRKPVDLVCVITLQKSEYFPPENQIQHIKNSFRYFLPWMADQDRLSIVIFTQSNDVPGSRIPPLTNMTLENKKKILSDLGQNLLDGEMTVQRALEAAVHILDQRNETNQTTAIFISGYGFLPSMRDAVQQIDLAKENLGLQDKGFIIQPFFNPLHDLDRAFAKAFQILRAGVVDTQFLVKPGESDLLKGVEIQAPYKEVVLEGWTQEDGAFLIKNPSLKPGLQEELAFDLKIPRITQALPSGPIEVKIASCQLIFTLTDGSQVVKEADLVVKIIREGEEYVPEEDREVVREFYRKWGDHWLFPTAWTTAQVLGHHQAREELKRYRESLDGSIVKDDEMLQMKLREMEEDIDRDEKTDFIDCF